ncbi:MAG: hypothetical protein LBV17_11420 [Treponema sp.]|jgi:hypothetical protein|nr:hypothetical protein [Treponema sp.]
MVNKKNWLGVLVFVLVFGMTVVGCENVQLVAWERAEAVDKVWSNVMTLHDGVSEEKLINVNWNPVQNAVSYNVYIQMVSNAVNDIHYLSTVQARGYGGGQVIVSFTLQELVSYCSETNRFGITVTDIDENHVPSKIVWSESITIPDYHP